MMKKLLVLLIATVAVASLVGCGGATDTQPVSAEAEAEEVVYISGDEIKHMMSDPEAFKGKHVVIGGQVFNVEADEEETYFQMYTDVENYAGEIVVGIKGFADLEYDDFVIIDGEIQGEFKGENVMGEEVSQPMIYADSAEIVDYAAVCSPTIKEVVCDNKVEYDGYSLTLNRVEFSETETRLFMTLENNGEHDFYPECMSAKVVQGSSQLESDYNWYYDDYNYLNDYFKPGIIQDGLVLFGKLNPDEPFTVYVEGFDDETYDDYTFEFTVEP